MGHGIPGIGVQLLLIVILLGCSRQKEETAKEKESLSGRVMELHDELMPKMDDLYRLKGQLQQKLEQANDLPEEKRRELESKIIALDSASRAMMVWMRQFDPAPDTLDSIALQDYFKEQMGKIEQVRALMLRSIDEAREEE